MDTSKHKSLKMVSVIVGYLHPREEHKICDFHNVRGESGDVYQSL